MKMWRFIFVIPLLAACSGPAMIPEDRYYRLHISSDIVPVRPKKDMSIVVTRPHADSLYLQHSLVYASVDSPRELRHYHYHFWAETPAEMLRHKLVDYLGTHFGAARVSEEAYKGTDPWYLRSTLKKLDRMQESDGWHSVVAVSIEFADSRRGRPVWAAAYEVDKLAAGDGMSASILAFDLAMEELLQQVATDILSHASTK